MSAPDEKMCPEAAEATSPVIDEAWAHRGELILYARRLLGAQGELAEDVVQEAFLRLHEKGAAGTPVRETRPWLFRVTRNLAFDERRRGRRGEAVRTSLEVVAAQPRGPLEVLQGREEAREALEGLDALPPRERRTVILDQAGLAPTAIARRMQTTTNAVHQSLFRARRRMRDTRAAAWALLPLPFVRLFVRAASSPTLDRLPALAPGSGGRLAGGAGLVGIVAATVIGGGVVADQAVIPHPGHVREASVPEASPAPIATSSPTTPLRSQASVGSVGPAAAPTTRSTAPVARSSRSGGRAEREAPERQDVPESGDAPSRVAAPSREVEDGSERRGPVEVEREDSVSRREAAGDETPEHQAPEAGAQQAPAEPVQAREPEHHSEAPEAPEAPQPAEPE